MKVFAVTEKEKMSDLISRQAAIDSIEREQILVERPITETRWFDFGLRKAQEVLSGLPSAEPERKKGRWIYEGKRGRFPACRCSECGNVENADWAILGDNVNYCPNCGADMKGDREWHDEHMSKL